MTETDHWVALEAGPYFWNADTIYQFLKETFNIIKPAVESIRKAEISAVRDEAAADEAAKAEIAVKAAAAAVGPMKAEAEVKALEATKRAKKAAEAAAEARKAALLAQAHSGKELENFVKMLSGQSKTVFGNKSWVEILGTSDYDVLKMSADNTYNAMKIDNDEAKKLCVVQLLRLIRNKSEHIGNLTTTFFGEQKGSEFHGFVSYWIGKFPRLIPFLWVKFYEYRSKLRNFYAVYTISTKNHFSLMPVIRPNDQHVDLGDVLDFLSTALIAHLEKGTVLKRFKQKCGPCSVEFRAFYGLTNMLNKTSSLSVQVIPGENIKLVVSHSTTENQLEYISTKRHPSSEKLILIFADNIVNDEIWRDCTNCECKVIVFGEEEKMKEDKVFSTAIDKFRHKNGNIELIESPVTGHDLTLSKQISIFEDGQVNIQDKHVKVKDIFSECTANEICNRFSGDFLNQLLREKIPKLFDKYKFPIIDQIYVERSLCVNGYLRVSEQIFDRNNEYNRHNLNIYERHKLFVLCGLSPVQLDSISMYTDNWYTLENFAQIFRYDLSVQESSEKNIIAFLKLEDPEGEIPMQIIRSYATIYPINAHYLRFDENNHLCYRVNEFTNVNCLQYFGKGYEKNFIQNLINESNKFFFIMAEPGGGKSYLLKSLGEKLLQSLESSLAIFYPFTVLVDKLEPKIKEDACDDLWVSILKECIEKFLCCSHDSEKYFLSKWLDQQTIRNKTGLINLLLDGLDEVPMGLTTLAVKALQIIQNKMKSIRLWVTSRQHISNENIGLSYDTVQLLPFTWKEQMHFFIKYFEKNQPNLNAEDLATKCIQNIDQEIEIELTIKTISTSPMHCNMFAQLFEEELKSSMGPDVKKLKLDKVDLYEGLLTKKIHDYMREKLNITVQAKRAFFRKNEKDLFDLHTYLALDYLFNKKFNELITIHTYTAFDSLEMGIVHLLNPLTFVHRTFAEYLIARFMHQTLLSEDKKGEQFNLKFNELLAEVISSNDNEASQYDVTCKCLDKMLNQCTFDDMPLFKSHSMMHPNPENLLDLCKEYVFGKFTNLFMFALGFWSLTNIEEFCCSALITAIRSKSVLPLDIFINLCTLLRINEKGMCHTNFSDCVVFISVLQKFQYEIAKYLIETKRWFPPKTWASITSMLKNGGGFMHIVLHETQFIGDTWEELYLNDIFRFLKYLHETEKSELTDKATKMVNLRDNSGRTVLMTLPLFAENDCMLLRTFLVKELGADVNVLLPDGRSILCMIDVGAFDYDFGNKHVENYHKTLELFINYGFNKIDAKTEKEGWTALACAVHVYQSKLQIKTLKLFHSSKFDFNAQDNQGNTILHFCVQSIENAAFAIPLIILGCSLSIKNFEGRCPLCLALDLKKRDMCKVLWRMMNEMGKKSCGDECRKRIDNFVSDVVPNQTVFIDDQDNIIQQIGENWSIYEWLVKQNVEV